METFGPLKKFGDELKHLEDLMGQTSLNQDAQHVSRVVSNFQSLLQLQLAAWSKGQKNEPSSETVQSDGLAQLIARNRNPRCRISIKSEP